MVPQRLFRSRSDRMIAGVAGGLGQYFGIDPTIVRLFFVLAAIFSGGLAIVAYIALWLLIPEEPIGAPMGPGWRPFSATPGAEEMGSATGTASPFEPVGGPTGFGPYGYMSEEQRKRRHQWFGWALVGLGVLVLASNIHLLSLLHFSVTWPLILIGAGVLLLFRHGYLH